MNEQMSLEDFKKQVEECLNQMFPLIKEENDRLMKLYEDDLPELLSWNCTPRGAAGIIASGLY
ncbi:MAG: hypothetical protein PHW00_04485 [Clostridia bacterium]|nr:hypothetical protein [Clostridia bacterium]